MKGADKQAIIRSLQLYNGGAGVIQASEFARFLGISSYYAKKKLSGLPAFEGKYYFLPDVADLVIERMEARDE